MAFCHDRHVANGQITQTVYTMIRDQRFTEAVQLLEQELQVRAEKMTCC